MLTSYLTNIILDKYNKGSKLTRKESIFYQNIPNTRKANLSYAYTHKELIEYSKCYNDPIYFIQEYCKIKLRVYQKEWIQNFIDNKYTIFCTSRQTGYSQVFSALYLWYCIFNYDKTIQIVSKKSSLKSFIEKIWNHYLEIPYFLKPGIRSKNSLSIVFDNGNKIKANSGKYAGIGYNIDILNYLDFAFFKSNFLNYKSLYPVVCASKNSKLSIQSFTNGNDLFKELLEKSELKEGHPDKNIYMSIKTYWWEVEGRDKEWKDRMIKIIGQKAFDQEYGLNFL